MQRCAHMLRSRRLTSQKRPRQTLTSGTEAHQKHQTRMQCGEHPTNDRSEHNARVTHSSRQHAKGRGGYSVQNRPNETTASGCSRDHHPTKKRLAEAETPNPLEAQNHSQVLVLASIDLRSQHGRLVSARFNASVRKGVQGSCNRAATQAAGRAYRLVLQRSRPRRGEKDGSKGLPGQNFSKGLLSLLPRHGVHRGRFVVVS